MTNSTVRCNACHRELDVSLAECLRNGWPQCCGTTMELLRVPSSTAAIDRAIFEGLGQARKARKVFKAGGAE